MTESKSETSTETLISKDEKAKFKVLHVDDDPVCLKVAQRFLEAKGYFEVETACSAEEAMEKMKGKEYDAVVSDYMMPGKDGLQFLKELREEGNGVPFIIFTGRGMEKVAMEALNLGADHYINKTTDPKMMFRELAHDICKAVERKRAQMEVWVREERLRAILDSSPDAIMITDLHGKLVDCNNAALKLTGLSSKEEIVGMNALEFIAEKDRKRASEDLKRTLEQGTVKDAKYNLLTKYGFEYIGEISTSVFKDSSGNPAGFVAIVRDTTERIRMENRLRRYSEQLEANQRFLTRVFAASPYAIIVTDLDKNAIECNQATLNMCGYPSKYEFMGKNLLALIAERDHPRLNEDLKKTQEHGAVQNIEYTLLTKDGREFPAELSASVIRDSFNNPLGFVVMAQDITARKNLQEKLIMSEKLAVIGQLAGAVSHDIRNPLSVIKNSAYFLQLKLKGAADEKVVKHLKIIEKEIDSATLIISELLDFTRKKPPILKETDLNSVVAGALSSISIPENVKVITKLGEIPQTLVDQEQIRRVFLNLILNAVQAMPEGGRLTIQTSKREDSVEIAFKDTGVGIPEENLPKLFTPLFSTKAKGVGLGLVTCKQIVESHGGNITVKSKFGEGSTFTVNLPAPVKEANHELSFHVELPLEGKVKNERQSESLGS